MEEFLSLFNCLTPPHVILLLYTLTFSIVPRPLIKATVMAVMENIRDLIRDKVRPHGCVGKWTCADL